MPNWVYNNMNVSGGQDAVEQFIADMSKPIPTFKADPKNKWGHLDGQWEEDSDIVFSFWNIIAPTDLEDYFTGDHWYSWNNTHWGTKWDARVEEKNVEQLDKGDNYVTYHFETAWGAPFEVFVALAEKYPHREFNIEWEEEQGFGAELVGMNGEISVIREWDIPSSHADYVERGKVDDCLCGYETDPENMFDDCPEAIEANEDENKLLPVIELTSVS